METGTDDGRATSSELTDNQGPAVQINPGQGQLDDGQNDGKSHGAPRMDTGPGNGPDPLPWKTASESETPGSGDGPDPLPWMHNTSTNAPATTAK